MKPTRRRVFSTIAGAAALLAAASFTSFAHAQSAFPSKTITVVVSYPAGGDTDALARLYAEKLSGKFGSPVVVENKPGASGTIGNSFVAKSAPDGHTLLFTPSTISIATLVLKSGTGVPYDAINDFTPIIQVGSQSLFLVASASSGVTSVKDLVTVVKGGKLGTYASPGSGSPMHVLGELFNNAAGVKMTQVPYRGIAPAVVDMLGGHVPFMYTTLGPVAQHVTSGKMVVIAVADAKRSSLLPNVPTLAESGYSEVIVGAWQGLMGPKGMPAEVTNKLNVAMNEILKMPDVVSRMTALATIPVGGDGAVLGRINAVDHNRYAKVIKDFGIQAD